MIEADKAKLLKQLQSLKSRAHNGFEWRALETVAAIVQRPSFDNSRAALAKYDEGQAERAGAWRRVETNEDIIKCEAMDDAAKHLVQDAYYEDTKHLNSRANCRRIHPDDVRRIIRAG